MTREARKRSAQDQIAPEVALTPEPSQPQASARALPLSVWMGFKRLTALGFPRRFPIVQFPNLPLIVAFLAGEAALVLHGDAHFYARSVSYLGMTIWAYEELVDGVLMVLRVGQALHS
jgi:hypothetical protein